jgi:hypothetical protein
LIYPVIDEEFAKLQSQTLSESHEDKCDLIGSSRKNEIDEELIRKLFFATYGITDFWEEYYFKEYPDKKSDFLTLLSCNSKLQEILEKCGGDKDLFNFVIADNAYRFSSYKYGVFISPQIDVDILLRLQSKFKEFRVEFLQNTGDLILNAETNRIIQMIKDEDLKSIGELSESLNKDLMKNNVACIVNYVDAEDISMRRKALSVWDCLTEFTYQLKLSLLDVAAFLCSEKCFNFCHDSLEYYVTENTLLCAIAGGDAGLIRKTVDIYSESSNPKWQAAIAAAIECGRPEVIRFLLSHTGYRLDWSLIKKANSSYNEIAVKYLLENMDYDPMGNLDSLLTSINKSVCIDERFPKIFKRLLRNRSIPVEQIQQNEMINSKIFYLMSLDCKGSFALIVDTIEEALEFGINPNMYIIQPLFIEEVMPIDLAIKRLKYSKDEIDAEASVRLIEDFIRHHVDLHAEHHNPLSSLLDGICCLNKVLPAVVMELLKSGVELKNEIVSPICETIQNAVFRCKDAQIPIHLIAIFISHGVDTNIICKSYYAENHNFQSILKYIFEILITIDKDNGVPAQLVNLIGVLLGAGAYDENVSPFLYAFKKF